MRDPAPREHWASEREVSERVLARLRAHRARPSERECAAGAAALLGLAATSELDVDTRRQAAAAVLRAAQDARQSP